MSDLFRFAQLQPFTLAGAGAVVGDTTIILKSMTDIDGNTLTMSGTFGDIGFGTLQPGSGTLEEQICFTGLTNNTNGTVTLTGVKSVSFTYPYTQTTGLAKTHAGASPFIISNTAGFYDKMTSKTDDETISGLWTFTTLPQSPATPTDNEDLTTKTYVDNVAVSGAPNANETTKGIVQLPTRAQAAAGTSSGSTGARLVIPASMASSVGASGTTVAVMSQTNGKIDPAFIDGTGNYTFTGTTTLAGIVSVTGTTTVAGAATFNGTTTFVGALSGLYDYQLFTSSGTWTKPTGLAGTELVVIQLWGAGGAGGTSAGGGTGGAGGGASYLEAKYRASDITSPVTVTIATAPAAGSAGGSSTFGTYLTAFGGGHGGNGTGATANGGGGGGGGIYGVGSDGSVGNPGAGGAGGAPIAGAGGSGAAGGDSTFGGGGGTQSNLASSANTASRSVYGGGGGGGSTGSGGTGGNSLYGGGGGGSSTGTGAGGTSIYGGNGGAGNASGAGVAGSAPGGGGGSGTTTGGAGGRGECRVWVIK